MNDCFIRRGSSTPTMHTVSIGARGYVINRGKYAEFNLPEQHTYAELLKRAVDILGHTNPKEVGWGWIHETKECVYFPPHILA
jgi:hypothetical protein